MQLIKPLLVSLTICFFGTLSAQVAEKAEDIAPLLIGESFPNVEVTGTDDITVSFHDLLREKPTVLIFYRGGWCPYCNAHLMEIGAVESDMLELGYQVIAVSPDKIEKLKDIEMMDDINYRLFSDAAGTLTKAAGLAFQAPDRYTDRLADWSGGKNNGFLPVPSVFVMNQAGEIEFEYINPNYKKRMSGEMLLAVLKVLKEEAE